MKLWLLCPIIGSGTFQNPYRSSVSDVSDTNVNNVIPTDQQGQPLYNFAFCRVGTANLSGVLAVTNSYAFPDYPLDGRMDGMESDARTGMVQTVQAYDMDGNGLHLDASHNDSDSYRQVLQAIVSQIEPAVNINTFDVAEPQS